MRVRGVDQGPYIISKPGEVVEQRRRYSRLWFNYLAASVQSLEVSDEAAMGYMLLLASEVIPRLA